jgi:Fe-S-cluster containining protein
MILSENKLTLVTPPSYQCYDCSGCGDCCRGKFAINISEEDYKRIIEQGWQNEDEYKDIKIAVKKGNRYQLAHHDNGTCIFLNKKGLCNIHAKFGESEKPLPCRLYPFRFIQIGKQVRLDIRYDCPQVAGNKGSPITTKRQSLTELIPILTSESKIGIEPILYGNTKVEWSQLCRITEAFERILNNIELSLTDRIIGCVNMNSLLYNPKIASLHGGELSNFLTAISDKIIISAKETTVLRVPPTAMVRFLFRQIMTIYTREDRVGDKTSLKIRLSTMLKMINGKGLIPELRTNMPQVDFDDVEQSFCRPTLQNEEIFTRYYKMRLSGMGFFGDNFYNRPYLDGLMALWLTYPVINWIARVYSVANDLDAPNRQAMVNAIMIMSHQHGASPIFNLFSERIRTRFLCERTNLRSLIVWYGY